MSTLTLALPPAYHERVLSAASAVRAVSTGTAASARSAELERIWALGLDAATGRFRPNEAETAVLIETALGVRLVRAPKWSRADWFDEHGVSYDAVGPFAAGRFEQQWRRFSEQILLHLRKADLVPVDVSLFTRGQTRTVERFIADRRLTPRVFTLGHSWPR
ncbi:hypothetical protein ODJ79_39075 [Actinoplanes sp. KI2]|uniref:hypothetical protein n=1 Tax=Actinoplanes sp. KI2 TaxID=2983315 RepID=UPI0021D611B0|nr:hypothetical protein [Actinoplanes sp. KI2]MCU7729757.1 hypothetical protein [Actinoplanes sp. KI2]